MYCVGSPCRANHVWPWHACLCSFSDQSSPSIPTTIPTMYVCSVCRPARWFILESQDKPTFLEINELAKQDM